MVVDSDPLLITRVLPVAEEIRARWMVQATDTLHSVLAQTSQPVVLERAEDSGKYVVRLIEWCLSLPDQGHLDMLEPARNGNPILEQVSQQSPQSDRNQVRLQ